MSQRPPSKTEITATVLYADAPYDDEDASTATAFDPHRGVVVASEPDEVVTVVERAPFAEPARVVPVSVGLALLLIGVVAAALR